MPKKIYSSKTKKNKYSGSESEIESEPESEIEIPVVSKKKKLVKKVKYYESESESEPESESESESELDIKDINKKLSKQIVKNDDETDIKNIIFEKINSEYYWGKYGDFEVIMNLDGYINVTKLCSEAKTKNGKQKEFRQWKKTSEAKELMDEISRVTSIPKNKLLYTELSSRENITRGSYAHAILVTHIACWMSPKFFVKVSLWIEEWKKYSAKNNFKYYKELCNLEPSLSSVREKEIQLYLQKKYKGQIEVKTKSGKIDLLTDKYLIEIKDYDNWKHAIGQLMVYSTYHVNKIKCMYLFNVGNNDTEEIKDICKIYDIIVKIYN
ncbi:putative KilA-n domain-containing protein [Megavirus vitis]|nr:putative KilA-n domain-containing protein [Megavirus vitis]